MLHMIGQVPCVLVTGPVSDGCNSRRPPRDYAPRMGGLAKMLVRNRVSDFCGLPASAPDHGWAGVCVCVCGGVGGRAGGWVDQAQSCRNRVSEIVCQISVASGRRSRGEAFTLAL